MCLFYVQSNTRDLPIYFCFGMWKLHLVSYSVSACACLLNIPTMQFFLRNIVLSSWHCPFCDSCCGWCVGPQWNSIHQYFYWQGACTVSVLHHNGSSIVPWKLSTTCIQCVCFKTRRHLNDYNYLPYSRKIFLGFISWFFHCGEPPNGKLTNENP